MEKDFCGPLKDEKNKNSIEIFFIYPNFILIDNTLFYLSFKIFDVKCHLLYEIMIAGDKRCELSLYLVEQKHWNINADLSNVVREGIRIGL